MTPTGVLRAPRPLVVPTPTTRCAARCSSATTRRETPRAQKLLAARTPRRRCAAPCSLAMIRREIPQALKRSAVRPRRPVAWGAALWQRSRRRPARLRGGRHRRFQCGLSGSEAFGAAQLVPSRLRKDEIGYDFAGVLLTTDEASLAGVRKDPRNRDRERVLAVLCRRLGMVPDRLRHGLGEDAIPWGRLRYDHDLDRELATLLQQQYRRAPGEVLGIAQVRDVLEASERMHSFGIRANWDLAPVRLEIRRRDAPVGQAVSALHKAHAFFAFRDLEGKLVAYADALAPQRRNSARAYGMARGDARHLRAAPAGAGGRCGRPRAVHRGGPLRQAGACARQAQREPRVGALLPGDFARAQHRCCGRRCRRLVARRQGEERDRARCAAAAQYCLGSVRRACRSCAPAPPRLPEEPKGPAEEQPVEPVAEAFGAAPSPPEGVRRTGLQPRRSCRGDARPEELSRLSRYAHAPWLQQPVRVRRSVPACGRAPRSRAGR